MKKDEVPQQDGDAFPQKFNVLQYAVDENGKFTPVKSVGWEPKTIVMQNALQFEQEKAEAARQLVIDGKRSPLFYHAKKHMMTARLLSGYTNIPCVLVWLHFRKKPFKHLKEKTLKKYREAFGYNSNDQLLSLD